MSFVVLIEQIQPIQAFLFLIDKDKKKKKKKKKKKTESSATTMPVRTKVYRNGVL
jgi:hypothetical protein